MEISMENEKIEIMKKWLVESKDIVFFGGAGVSTESGIPDFRSVDGIYNQHYKYPPETIISNSFFRKKPEEFYNFYKDRMVYTEAEPNITHKKLAELEQKGKLLAVVTQNIDGLHQQAGSKKVYELHGSIHRNYCMKCHKYYELDNILNKQGIPRCECGGIIKPDVVLYEEALDQDILSAAIHAISKADMLIVGGTSLAVYPAASLIQYYKGNRLVLINKSATPYDNEADLLLTCSLGRVFNEL